MSKFTGAAPPSTAFHLVAMEEASRVGQRTADIDHLLLALALNEEAAGRVLRSLGVTLDATREAVTANHQEHLAALGVQTPTLEPGRIVFHETTGYSWSDRALSILKRASESEKRGGASAVLRELVGEPSGTIDAILQRLGTTPNAVIGKLDDAELDNTKRQPTEHLPRTDHTDALATTREVFVPASPEQVWALLTDPSRTPEWDPNIGSVENARAPVDIGDTWSALARTERPDGKPIGVKPNFVTQRVAVVALEPSRLIEWRMTFPDAPQANSRHLRIAVEPAVGGSQLLLSLAWERNRNRSRRPIVGFVLRPLSRLLVRMQISLLASSISRAFR